MKTLNGQELELFRAGNYGAKGTYTPADLQELAAGYNPAKHEVPICIGHPTLNAPAFGWIGKLRAEGDTLFGTPHQVVPAFDQAVQTGMYKKRSIALTRAADGKLDLRHVGYLGAMLPEVRGLADAAFSAEAFQEFEFSNEAPHGTQGEAMSKEQQDQTMREAVSEFFANLVGKKPDATDTSALEARLEAKLNTAIAAKDAKIASLETQFSAQQATGAAEARQRRVEGVISQLKIDKRWVPAYDKMQVPALFAALATAPVQEIVFAEGATEVKLDPIAAFSKFLAGLGKIVPEGQAFASDKQGVKIKVPVVDGATVSAGSAAFDAEIKAHMAEHKVSYQAAADALTREGKDSLSYGGASSGEV